MAQLFEQHWPLLPHVMPLFVQAIVVAVVETDGVCAPTETVNASTANVAKTRTVSFFIAIPFVGALNDRSGRLRRVDPREPTVPVRGSR